MLHVHIINDWKIDIPKKKCNCFVLVERCAQTVVLRHDAILEIKTLRLLYHIIYVQSVGLTGL